MMTPIHFKSVRLNPKPIALKALLVTVLALWTTPGAHSQSEASMSPPPGYTPSTMQSGPSRGLWTVGNIPDCDPDYQLKLTGDPALAAQCTVPCAKGKTQNCYRSLPQGMGYIAEYCQGLTPQWNWILATCDSAGAGPKGFGSACAINSYSTVNVYYAAAYQLQPRTGSPYGYVWVQQEDSSINTGNSSALANLNVKDSDGNYVFNGPSPAAIWSAGFYPRAYKARTAANSRRPEGVGPPAAMFLLSVKKLYNASWFAINQRGLNLGPTPSAANCKSASVLAGGNGKYDTATSYGNVLDVVNCWGNPGPQQAKHPVDEYGGSDSGEIDFLESPWFDPTLHDPTGYLRLYATGFNSAGFAYPVQGTQNGVSGLQGGSGTTSYFVEKPYSQSQDVTYVAILDARGTTIYRYPGGPGSAWPGITLKTAAKTIPQVFPVVAPASVAAPCSDPTQSCARFLPSCVTRQVDNSDPMFAIPRKVGVGNPVSRLFHCDSVHGDVGGWWPVNGTTRPPPSWAGPGCDKGNMWNQFIDTNQYQVDMSKNAGDVAWAAVAKKLYQAGADSQKCFGWPRNQAQPQSFPVSFNPSLHEYEYTDVHNCPKGKGGPGCWAGPKGDFANHCRQCTLDKSKVTSAYPLCPAAYSKCITYGGAGPDKPNPSCQ